MAGIIDDTPQEQLPPDEEAPEGAQPPEEELGPEEAPSEGGITPEAVQAKMQVPPEFKDAYTRVVAAGMKVMFDQQTHPMAMKHIQSGEGSIGQRLGNGIAGLVFVLAEKAKGAIPLQVFLPVGTTLLVTAADFLKKSGTVPVTDKDVAEGLNVLVETVLKTFKLDPEKVKGYRGKPGLVDRPQAPDEPQPEQPPTDEPQPPMMGA